MTPSTTSTMDNDSSLITVEIVAADDISCPSKGMGFWMIFLMSTDVYRVCSIGKGRSSSVEIIAAKKMPSTVSPLISSGRRRRMMMH